MDAVDSVPSGSVVDARRGTITLVSALGSDGRTQSVTLRGARFRVVQAARRRGLVDIHLREPASGCRRMARAAASRKRRRAGRRLWAQDDKGRYRTHGRTSATTVRGTRWTTQETCAGTRTTVEEGSVVVRHRRTGRRVVVRPGKSFLARVWRR